MARGSDVYAPTESTDLADAGLKPIPSSSGPAECEADLRAAVAGRAECEMDVIKVMASDRFATPETDQLGVQFTAAEPAVHEAHRAGLRIVAHHTRSPACRTLWRPA